MTHYPTTAASAASAAEKLDYRDLRSIARHLMANESSRCTLTATGLVHEFYLRLAKYTASTPAKPGPSMPDASAEQQTTTPLGNDSVASSSPTGNAVGRLSKQPGSLSCRTTPARTAQTLQTNAQTNAPEADLLGAAPVNQAAALVQSVGTGTLSLASRVMKQILVDRARRRHTRRTAEQNHCTKLGSLSARSQQQQGVGEKTLQFESALEILEREMPETAELVRLRVYLDVSVEEAAVQLGLSRATAYRKWTFAKAWLAEYLQWPLENP